MKFILHIGMGKTGTTSLQKTLDENGLKLRQQSAIYLGMWFDMINEDYRGLRNQGKFFSLPPDEVRASGDRLYDYMLALATAEGLDTFIMSNEAFSGKAVQLQPLLRQLVQRGVEVRVIGYLRNPADWLPSAYVQWGVRHKMEPGRIQPYGPKARKLVNWYEGLIQWHEQMPALLELRSYDAAPDVVADFAAATGVALDPTGQRILERAEDAEVVLRALFNDAIKAAVLPERFNRAVLPDLRRVAPVGKMIADSLDYSETDTIIAERAALFDRLTDICGFDPRQTERRKPTRAHDAAQVKERIFDALVQVTLDQALKIRRIEDALERLSKGEALVPGSFGPTHRS